MCTLGWEAGNWNDLNGSGVLFGNTRNVIMICYDYFMRQWLWKGFKGWKCWKVKLVSTKNVIRNFQSDFVLCFNLSFYFIFSIFTIFSSEWFWNKFRFNDFTITSKHHKSNMSMNWYEAMYMALCLYCKLFR